jgi:hypothetical protein
MAKAVVLVCVLLIACCAAHATPMDLSSFFADGEVTFSSDGTVATFAESADHMETFLSGDPGVISAGPGVWLQFDYVFTEGAGTNDDEFGAWIIDPVSGGSIGALYKFWEDSSSGTFSFDLSSLPSTSPWGLQFQLSSLDGDLGTNSTLQISNVQLVPEPVTVVALGSLLVGIFTARRLKRD